MHKRQFKKHCLKNLFKVRNDDSKLEDMVTYVSTNRVDAARILFEDYCEINRQYKKRKTDSNVYIEVDKDGFSLLDNQVVLISFSKNPTKRLDIEPILLRKSASTTNVHLIPYENYT